LYLKLIPYEEGTSALQVYSGMKIRTVLKDVFGIAFVRVNSYPFIHRPVYVSDTIKGIESGNPFYPPDEFIFFRIPVLQVIIGSIPWKVTAIASITASWISFIQAREYDHPMVHRGGVVSFRQYLELFSVVASCGMYRGRLHGYSKRKRSRQPLNKMASPNATIQAWNFIAERIGTTA
jgi:hypothetical protein